MGCEVNVRSSFCYNLFIALGSRDIWFAGIQPPLFFVPDQYRTKREVAQLLCSSLQTYGSGRYFVPNQANDWRIRLAGLCHRNHVGNRSTQGIWKPSPRRKPFKRHRLRLARIPTASKKELRSLGHFLRDLLIRFSNTLNPINNRLETKN